MEENNIIIWYTSKIDEFEKLVERKFILDEEFNSLTILHTDLESCVNYIESIPKVHVFLITTIFDAHCLLSHVHSMRQIDSVFLVSMDSENCEDLLAIYSKIIACFNDTKTLMKSLKENIQLAQEQTLMFSFYNQHKKPTRDLSKESALFIWFQLFKNALLNMSSNDSQAKQDLVQFLRQRYRSNNKQIRLINEFERSYKPDDAIRWYTGQPFLYRHVNKALRTEDIDQLYIFRFFISDLCKSLFRESGIFKEYGSRVTLYRGTRISIEECEKLKTNEGHLISMNGFMSTSLSIDVALSFAGTSNETHQAVLFEIECDLNEVESVVLAQIVRFSAIQSEEEVLIDIGAVFQLMSVKSQKNLMLIKMKATDEGMKISKIYLEINQDELKEKNVRIIWGDLLLDMGKSDQALEYFQKIQALDGSIEDWQLHIHIGHALAVKGLHRDAVDQYLRANEIWEKHHSTSNVSILSHLSSVFIRYGIYDHALPIILKNLEIYENLSDTEHDRIYYHDIASLLSGIGSCYFHMGNYNLAITYFNRAYEMRESYYTPDHYESAKDLDDLGDIYRAKGDYRRALHCFAHATSIYDRILPADHPDAIDHLSKIAVALSDQNKQEDALKYFRQVTTLLNMNPSDRLEDIAYALIIVAHITSLEGDKEHYLEYTQKALEIKRKYLPKNHHDLADYLTTMANVLAELNRHDEARVHYNEALNIYNEISPDGYPSVAVVLHGIGFHFQIKCDYKTALSYYANAQIIYQKHFSSSSQDFIRLLLCVAEVYKLQGEYYLAIDAFKSCLATIRKHCENTNPLLKKAYMMLADTYMFVDSINEALYTYEKGFSIEIDDDIEHYVYHVGYRLLMLSSAAELEGKYQMACDMRKNAFIILKKLDYHNLYSLIKELFELRGDGNFSTIDSSVYDLYAKIKVRTTELIDTLTYIDESAVDSSEQQYLVRKITYYYYSMYLYQQLLMNGELRAALTTFLGCYYETQARCGFAQYYYEKAQNLYRLLLSEKDLPFDRSEIVNTISEITTRISHIQLTSVTRTFFFLWNL